MVGATIKWTTRVGFRALTAAAGLATGTPSASAAILSYNLDIVNVRNELGEDEGYLSYRHAGPTFNGEERTGWTDIRHPANDGTNFTNLVDTNLGYDRSDFSVRVSNKIVTVNKQVGPGTETGVANIPRDFDYANQIWAQAGISVFSTEVRNVDHSTGNAAGNPVVTSPISTSGPSPDDIDLIQGTAANRAAAPVVNSYYTTIANSGAGLRGITSPPAGFPASSGIMQFNSAVADTMAHELGHFLFDRHRFANADPAHSPTNTDLMADGDIRLLPNANQKGDGNDAPSHPGTPRGNIGGVDRLNAPVKLNGAGPDLTQIEAVHLSASVAHVDNGFRYGDVADFDWVEDNIRLETAGRTGFDNLADNHDGVDFMVWEIANIAPSPHTGHEHDDWGELTKGRYNGSYFRGIDVFSQIARYADMDVNESGNWTKRDAALDYYVQFSNDGVNWFDGEAIAVFVDGWTFESVADDYVARWLSPIDATQVRIGADPISSRRDGNTQIDAIMATIQTVPEPGTLALWSIGLAALALARRWRGRDGASADQVG